MFSGAVRQQAASAYRRQTSLDPIQAISCWGDRLTSSPPLDPTERVLFSVVMRGPQKKVIEICLVLGSTITADAYTVDALPDIHDWKCK